MDGSSSVKCGTIIETENILNLILRAMLPVCALRPSKGIILKLCCKLIHGQEFS
jgi:hypothetical protein